MTAGSDLASGVLTIHVPPGAGHASFHVAGCVVVEREATAVAGGVVDWGEVTLTAAALLVGRVVDAEGNAVAAFVYPRAGATTVPLTSTDEAGAFSFDGLPYGEVELRAEGNALCVRCHLSGHYDTTAHHFHQPGSPAPASSPATPASAS